jgi:hypothetical protein
VHWDDRGAHILDRWHESDLSMPDNLDAFIEGPFVRWWRAADRLHPGSHFILTTRDKAAWLESVERWMARTEPPVGDEWFNRRLFHWGTTHFHRELFSAAWDEHHESIDRYFRGRYDLLEIDIASLRDAELWEAIAGFVGRRPPKSPFPHLNRSMQ